MGIKSIVALVMAGILAVVGLTTVLMNAQPNLDLKKGLAK